MTLDSVLLEGCVTGMGVAADATLPAWTARCRALAPVMGEAGFAALLRHTVQRAVIERPWLAVVMEAAPGAELPALQRALAPHDSASLAATHEAMERIFFETLDGLLAPSLTRPLLQGKACEHAAAEAGAQLVAAALGAQALEATALEAHRRQVGFLATVAHELRNPLMPLRLAAHMLDRARTDDAAHAKLQATITGQVAQMTRLIGDLLEGSRFATGNFRLERAMVDFGAVIDRAVETCQPGMDERGHCFAVDMPPGPIRVLGDSVRLVQVLGNILENASKYTPQGGAISLRTDVRGNAVVVTVKDNGIGISAKALPHVFDLFVRDAHATAVNEGGLGIGLAVVRELVRAHEGAVVARSAGQGLGSEIVVTLPLALSNARLAGGAPA